MTVPGSSRIQYWSYNVTHSPSKSYLTCSPGHLQRRLSQVHVCTFLPFVLSERRELDGIQNCEEEANEITFSMWPESALLNGLSAILREAAGPSQQDQPLIPPGTADERDPGGAF